MLKNIPREQVIAVVKRIGPTIPTRIVKELGGDTFLIGAILSDLTEKGMVKVSQLKLGGSPFYYLPEQTQKLESLNQYLNEKDRQTCERLKEAKVMKDDEQDTFTRVSLRNIKDFAKPIDVKMGDRQELFWKYYLITNDDVKIIVKEKFMKKSEAKEEAKSDPSKEEKKEVREEKKEIKEEKEHIKEKIVEKPKEQVKEVEKPKEMVKEEKKEIKKETQEHLQGKKEEEKAEHNFEKLLKYYFENKKIEIIEKMLVKKTEMNCIIRVPTPIGFVEYYCVAKDKKKCNEGDIATAFVQGQNKKLPVLFLTTGELAKKAEDMLAKEFKGVTVNKI